MFQVDELLDIVTTSEVGSSDLTEVLRDIIVSVSEAIVVFNSEIIMEWFFSWYCKELLFILS